ncbi:MAG: DUF4837 family protein [Calditrichaeota bacterium]|nr:MAG: DUF4837 family protein [Calditrichota bacterium]
MRFLTLLIFILFIGCDGEIPKRDTLGPHDQILVIADSSDFVKTKKALEKSLEAEVLLPAPEKLFTLKFMPLEKYERYKRWQNILILSILDEEGKADGFVKSVLSEEAQQKVTNGEVFLGIQKNIWTKNQGLAYLVGKDAKSISEFLELNGERLLEAFLEVQKQQLLYVMFKVGEQDEISEELWEKFGWKVRVQFDYVVANADEDNDFVWLRRFYPDRFLSVKSFEGTGTENYSPEFWINLRNEIGVKYHQSSEVDTLHTTAEKVDFLGYQATKLTGLWAIRKDLVGGPFRSYCFFDAKAQKYFLVDLAVFAPGEAKKNYLTQLEIIASTFEAKPIK